MEVATLEAGESSREERTRDLWMLLSVDSTHMVTLLCQETAPGLHPHSVPCDDMYIPLEGAKVLKLNNVSWGTD